MRLALCGIAAVAAGTLVAAQGLDVRTGTDGRVHAVTFAGVPANRGMSLLTMDDQWKALYNSGRETVEVRTRTEDGARIIEATQTNRLAEYSVTATVKPDEVLLRHEYDIKPHPGLQHVELCVGLPTPLCDGAQYEALAAGKTTTGAIAFDGRGNGVLPGLERLTLRTFWADITWDFSGSTVQWNFDDLTRTEWAKSYRFRYAPSCSPEEGARGVAVIRVTAEPPSTGPLAPLDLSGAANRGFRDDEDGDQQGGWSDQGDNDLRALSPGKRSMVAVPFEILDGSEADARSCLVLRGTPRPYFPAEAGPIPVNAALSRLYFLHTCAWSAEWRQPVAEYRVQYEDGRTAQVAARYGLDISDWWGAVEPLRARLGLKLNNGHNDVGLYVMRWENPRPDEPIVNLSMASSNTGAVPILVAVTGLQSGVLAEEQVAVLDDVWKARSEQKVSTEGWVPIAIPWTDRGADGTALDVSFLLDPPAGKHGFLRCRDGKFVFEEPAGRARFWGTNAALRGPFPPKELAPGIARAWAQQGVNMVRMHLYAVYEETMIAPDGGLNSERLDEFEFLIAELKKQGIYTYMDLNDGMLYARLLEGPAKEKLAGIDAGSLKRPSLFDPDLIAAQKKLATMLFTHVNPYTGLRMCDDPAVALYEITNENSFLSAWGDLKQAFPEPYYTALKQRWNEWLGRRYPDRAALARAWEEQDGFDLPPDQDPAQGTVELPPGFKNAPMTDGRRFAIEMQAEYHRIMYEHLRSIGVKAPITGNNLEFALGDLEALKGMDFTAEGAYWTHPNVRAKPITFSNSIALATDAAGPGPLIANMGRTQMVGKPYVVREWNFCFPNDFRCEGMMAAAAYGALQDWDGLLFYCATGSFNGGQWQSFVDDPKILIHSQQTDPATWGQSQACALAYLRGDVRPANTTVRLLYTDADVHANRELWHKLPFLFGLARVEAWLPGPGVLPSSPHPLVQWRQGPDGSREISFGAEADAASAERNLLAEARKQLSIAAQDPDILVSDTGEIARDARHAILTVDTERTASAVGALGELEAVDLQALRVESETRFCAIAVSALDGKPIVESGRLLVTAVARARNTGQEVEAGRLLEWGTAPVLFEPVKATLLLKRAPRGLRAFALDPAGGRRKSEVPITDEQGRAAVRLTPEAATIYYEIAAE